MVSEACLATAVAGRAPEEAALRGVPAGAWVADVPPSSLLVPAGTVEARAQVRCAPAPWASSHTRTSAPPRLNSKPRMTMVPGAVPSSSCGPGGRAAGTRLLQAAAALARQRVAAAACQWPAHHHFQVEGRGRAVSQQRNAPQLGGGVGKGHAVEALQGRGGRARGACRRSGRLRCVVPEDGQRAGLRGILCSFRLPRTQP